ncbi:1790_t:CDS:1, partial [Funneliformis mosseae]
MSQFSFAHLQANIKINIFKFMRSPLNLALCNRGWSNVARDPHARTEWLIYQFGKTYAFFHGIRLGSTFINKE